MAGVVHATGAHARQVHADQRLLDALPAPPVAFDDRRLEDRALELGRLQFEPAGLGGQRAVVMAGPVRLPSAVSLVSGGAGDLIGLRVEHGAEDLGHLLGDQPAEPGLEHVPVDLYDVAVGHGCRIRLSNHGF